MQINTCFRKVHAKKERTALVKRTNCIKIDHTWSVKLPADGPAAAAFLDFKEYLQIAMDVTLCKCGEKQLSVSVVPELGNTYEIIVGDAQVTFCGGTAAAAAQAIYRAEDMMKDLGGPYLEQKVHGYTPCVFPRLVSSGIQENRYPEDYLKLILHYGYHGILVTLREEEPESFAELLFCAHELGLLVLADIAFPYSTPDVFGRLLHFGFDGFIFGRAFDFSCTSKLLRAENRNDQKCIHNPDAFEGTCRECISLLTDISKVVQTENPKAFVVLDTSGWAQAPEQEKIALIKQLPSNIIVLSSFDGGQKLVREQISIKTHANTLLMAEASEVFLAEYEAAKQRGLTVWAYTAASGRTDDFGLIPYIPAMMQWLLRLDEIKQMEISGAVETGAYGFVPSIVSAFAKEQFTVPCKEAGVCVQQLAARYYGAENMEKLILVFKKLSDGVNFLLPDKADRKGPFLSGPAFPLLTDRQESLWKTEEIYAYPFAQKDITLEVDCLLKAAEHFDNAAVILKNICTQTQEEAVTELYAVCTLLTNTLITCVNAKRWYRRRAAFRGEEGFKKRFLAEQMVHIAQQEIKNAQETAELIAAYPFLSGNAKYADLCSLERLEEKIQYTEKAILELKEFLQK